MKQVSRLADPDVDLLELHVWSGYTSGPYQTVDTLSDGDVAADIAANSEGDGWGWVEFEIDTIYGADNYNGDIKFALQWYGERKTRFQWSCMPEVLV